METVHGRRRRRQRSSPAVMSSRPHQPYAGNSSHPHQLRAGRSSSPHLRWLMLETVLVRRRRQRSSPIVKPFHPHQPHAGNSYNTHQLCSAKSSSSHLRWLMLDQFVHRTKGDGNEVVMDAVPEVTLSEISFTCTGKPIRVSLRVAEPPAVSRLYLHWPEGFRPELRKLNEPSVITAHGDSILFMAFVPLLENCLPYCYPIDYFVYTASRSEKPPSLTQLPPCFIGGQEETELDNYYRPYRYQRQRMMFSADIGLLCCGHGKFTVAELTYSGELCLLQYAPGQKNLNWELKHLVMPYDEGTPNLLCGSWQTDTVIPFHGCYLCWVDNYLGLLLVDVLGKDLNLTIYVPLPAALDSNRLHIDLGAPDPARRVFATESGTIKLISISDKSGRSVHDSSNLSFIIRIWSLINIEKGDWEEVATMKGNDFWNVLHVDRRLPHCVPQFPVLSLVDPDVIFFQLHDSCHIFWLVEIDMNKKKLGAVTLYIDDEEEGHPVDDTTRRNVFHGNSFILSQFTQYMDKHAIKSLEYSEKLQKAKLERALEKR